MLLKKKNILIFSIILISILGLSFISASDSCSDGDLGTVNQYKNPSSISGVFDGKSFTYSDWCDSAGDLLNEQACSIYGLGYTDTISCSSKYGSDWKCSSGACVQIQKSCSDTDGSNDKNKGTVTTSYNNVITKYNDECSTRESNSVIEYICQNNWVATTTIDCLDKYGLSWDCVNGACVQDTCSDSDYGTINQYKTKGTTTGKTGGIPFSNVDSCYNNILTEQFCSLTGTPQKETIDCTTKFGLSYICQNGACVKADDTCSDSDSYKGINQYKTKGTVTGKFNGISFSNIDWCDNNTGKLTEYICTLSQPPQSTYEFKDCSDLYGIDWKCYNGACTKNDTIQNCTLKTPEECGDGILNICDEKECTNCGWYFKPNKILPGGTCSTEPPSPECKTCDDFAFSYLLGDVFKSKKCDATGWTLQWSFFFIKPPQGTTTCLLSLIKLILMPIVLIFGFLFINDFFDNKVKSLKGKKNNIIRMILSGIIAILLALLVYVMFIVGLVLFIIILVIKYAIKTII